MSVITYNLCNFEQISKDVAHRSKILLDFKTIVQKKIRIESDYLSKMKQLGNTPELRKISNPIRSTQILFNSLINSIFSEIDNISNHVQRMEVQISKQLSSIIYQLDNQAKRQVTNASLIIRDYDKRYEEIQKMKSKVFRKGAELKKFKEEYIIGNLIEMPFDKKNKLFIRTKEIQEGYKPLRDEYDLCVKNFNQRAVAISQKLKDIITRLQNSQNQKVELMKKIFMVLQISNSEYGANLFQDKASILSRLNNLQNTHPEFKKSDMTSFQAFKNQMLIQQHDPFSYINNLFTNIVDTKNMQGLVIYGHQAKHRESITSCMMESAETVDIGDKNDFALVKEIANCFKNVFNQQIQADLSKIQRLKQLMEKSPQGRKNFILCLQKFRTFSKFDISLKKLPYIEDVLNTFLDYCLYQLDTYNSKLLLVLSFTYYVQVDNQRVDLHNYIQGHKIWKDKEWWQCALLQSSYQQLKVKPKKMQQPPITIWHIKGSGLKNSQNQHQLTSQHILFNQLTFYLHNMRLFQIKQEIITYIGKKYAKQFQLSAKIAANIQEILIAQEPVSQEFQVQSNGNGSPISNRRKAIKKFFSKS